MEQAAAKLFRTTAAYHARYRPNYPASLFDHLVRAYRLVRGTYVADVGCGTGQIAIPLARRGMKVVAVDPSAEMLAEGARLAVADSASARIRWVQGIGEELTDHVDRSVRLVTFAASFHWMNPDLVLAQCEQIVEPDGGVALISGGVSPWFNPETAWAQAVRDSVTEFLGEQRRAGDGLFAPPSERHEQVLARSAFSRVDSWTELVAIERTLEEMIGLQYSTSYSSPGLLGERKEAFEAVLRARLLEACPDGRFIETFRLQALCAWRPPTSC